MLLKIIIEVTKGRKYEFIKYGEDLYIAKHYEYYQSTGWRLMVIYDGYTKEDIERDYNIKID